MNNDNKNSEAEILRHKAEELLKKKASRTISQLTESETLKLIHELDVHQIELEMQTEELVIKKEQLLKKANEKYVELYDFVPSGCFTLSIEGVIIELNLCSSQMLGKERVHLINRPFGIFVSRDTRPMFNLFLENLRKIKAKTECEITILPNKSSPRNVHLSGIFSREKDQYHLTAIDITQRKEIENELKLSETKFRTLFESANDAIFIMNDKVFKDCNPKTEIVFGCRHDKIINHSPAEFSPFMQPSGRLSSEEATEKIHAALSGKPQFFYWKHQRYDGTLLDAEVSLNKIEIKGEECLQAIVRDISERKQAEQELAVASKELDFQNAEKIKREAELIFANNEIAIQTALNLANAEKLELTELHEQALDRLHKIACMVPGVVYQYKLRPDGTSCFPYASEAIKEIYRLTPDEVRYDASRVFANIHPDDLAGVAASIEASAKDLTPWQHEYRVKFSDGTIRSLYGNALPQREADGSVLWHGFITDVTDRLNAEKATRETDRLLRENNSRMDLAMQVANMAWWEMDVTNGNVTFDKRKTDMLGYSHEKFTHYKDFTDLVHPEDYKRAMNAMRRHFMGVVDKYEAEYRILTSSGKYKWFYDIGSVVSRDSGGLPLYVRGLVLDITDRKQMEEELNLVSRRLEIATHASGMGVFDFDIVNNNLLLDDRMFSLYGIEKKDFAGGHEALKAVIHPDDFERSLAEIEKAMRGEKDYDTEFRVTWPDGSVHNIRALAVILCDESGKSLRMIGTNWDITALRHAEKEKLDDSENRYRSIFQGSPDGIIIADPETKMIIFANPAQCQMLGYTEEELKMMNIAAIHPVETYQHELATFEKQVRGEKNFPHDIQCLKKNGEIFYADISMGFLDMNGRQYIVGFFRDITDRKHAEAMFEDIVAKNPLSIQIVDKDGYTITGNPAYIKLFGAFPPPGFSIFADLEGKSPEFKKLILHAKSGKVAHLPDIYYNPKDISPDFPDSPVWIRALIFPLNDNAGKPERYVLMHLNITERREAEVAIKEALVKAESGNRLKTAFMQNISHEVRTPLNGILGFGKLLIESDLTDSEKQQFVSLMQASADRLVNTITDYMDIALIISDNMNVSRKSVNVMQALTGLKNKFQNLCNEKKLAFNLIIPPENESFCIQTDPELFLKIISHLLDNAIKFTREGSITMGFSVGLAKIDFFCKDTGIGINKEAQERIFESFVQENMAITRGYEGSGLGLSIIRGLTNLLGGEIRLESITGQGTTFFLSLPVALGSPGKDETAKVRKRYSATGELEILIVEDDFLNLKYIETILRKVVPVIYKAINGLEAVDLCRKHPGISMVLMDIKMPVMNGFEAAREIRKFNNNVIIIAQTAYAHAGIREEAIESGCNDYITKPIEKTVLLALMGTYFKMS